MPRSEDFEVPVAKRARTPSYRVEDLPVAQLVTVAVPMVPLTEAGVQIAELFDDFDFDSDSEEEFFMEPGDFRSPSAYSTDSAFDLPTIAAEHFRSPSPPYTTFVPTQFPDSPVSNSPQRTPEPWASEPAQAFIDTPNGPAYDPTLDE